MVGPKAAADRSMQGSPVVVKCEYWMTPFSTGARRARGRADRHNMEMALLLETVVQQSVMQEALGRCQIEISVTVLEADGGAEPCAINAVMLALADAGASSPPAVCCPNCDTVCLHLGVAPRDWVRLHLGVGLLQCAMDAVTRRLWMYSLAAACIDCTGYKTGNQ